MSHSIEFTAVRGLVAAHRAYYQLTSPVVVTLLLVSLVTSLGLGGLAWYFGSQWLWGITLLDVSGLVASALVFTFGATHYRYVTSPLTVAQLQKEKGNHNLALACDFFAVGIFRDVDTTRNGPEVFSRLLERLLADERNQRVLQRLELTPDAVQNQVTTHVLPQLSWATVAETATRVAYAVRSAKIGPEHVLAGLLLQPALQTYERGRDLQDKDILFVTWWLTQQRASAEASARWWEPQRLLSFSGIGLRWTSGFTPVVDQLSRFPRGNLWDQIIVGREQYVDQLITTLARQRQSNVLLVGSPGVGRLGIVLEMVRRVHEQRAHPELNGQRVVYLHIGEVLAQAGSNAGQLQVVSRVLNELERAGNIIVVVDGLGSILAEAGETRVNMTDILLPFFSSLAVRVVVIISSDEYHLRLKTNEELVHFFEVVQIESSTPPATLQTLALAAPALEEATGIYLPYATLRATVEDTESILPHIPYPERAFDFLEEALTRAQGSNARLLSRVDIENLITQKVGVPVGQVRAQERQHLLSLEQLMHKRVVNQQRAVAAVARAMIRARAGVRNQARPIGTFLFLGPTGVGKTETAKTLAAAYFGSEEYLTRLDMTEFQSPDSLDTLLGSTRQPVGRLSQLISSRPFTVVLLDEFEKASQHVQQLFLQVFDEGRLTDAGGQHLSFTHAIIIATSNAGAEFIRQSVKGGTVPEDFDTTLREHILQQKIFRPELLNRFDGVVTFTPLSPEHVQEVARRMLAALNKRLDEKHGITVAITDELVNHLLSIGYNPEFGARPMQRAIQDTVEYTVARRILQGATKPGQQITLTPAQLTPNV